MNRCLYYRIPFACTLILLVLAVRQSQSTITENDIRALETRMDLRFIRVNLRPFA